jgi:hypothetical protein
MPPRDEEDKTQKIYDIVNNNKEKITVIQGQIDLLLFKSQQMEKKLELLEMKTEYYHKLFETFKDRLYRTLIIKTTTALVAIISAAVTLAKYMMDSIDY